MGQRETAAPMFSGLFAQLRQLENTLNRRGLSAICQPQSRPKADSQAGGLHGRVRPLPGLALGQQLANSGDQIYQNFHVHAMPR
jgi:hypothetical protein